MKQIYINEVHEDKVVFLQGDHRTSSSTFYYDEDIKDKCFEILTKLNLIDNELKHVNIYYHNNKIYGISEDNNNCDHYFSTKITPTSHGYSLKLQIFKNY
jgi:hypothetical protein